MTRAELLTHGLAFVIAGSVTACSAPASDTWVLGKEKATQVVRVEDHSDALLYFLKKGFKKRSVIHLDFHDDSRPVPDASIDRIRQLAKQDDYETLKNKSGISFGSTGKLFNIGNFLYAGYKLGVVKEVYWVMPTPALPKTAVDGVKRYLETVGFGRESTATFHYEDGYIRGRRNGLPIILCTQTDLPRLDEPAILSLDIDYLTGLYKDPVATPLGELTLKLFDDLSAAEIRTDFAVISYSVRGITMPLMNKYVGDYLYEMIADPGAKAKLGVGIVKSRDAALRARFNKDTKASMDILRRALSADEGNASLYYELALAHLARKELDLAQKLLERTIEIDPAYFLGYVEIGGLIAYSKDVYPGLSAQARLARASAFLNGARRLVQGNAEANRELDSANALFFSKQVRKAQIYYSKALKAQRGILKREFNGG